jgi:hypothetical protein
MAYTNFNYGLQATGIPVQPGTPQWKPFSMYLFVDPDNITNAASDGNTGLTASDPLVTMERAFQLATSGALITFWGNIREQISAPLGLFDVTIVGAANAPRHADAFDGKAGYTGATWRPEATPVATTPLLTIQSQGWRLQNFLMTTGVAATPLLRVARNSESGDDEIDGGHVQCIGMRFDGAPIGIEVQTTGFVQVYNCFFRGMTTAAIASAAGGPGTNGFWYIDGNRFYDNVVNIDIPLVQSTISNNVFGTFTTTCIDLTGGSANVVGPGNVFSGTYDNGGGYTESGTDTWAGNYTEAGVTTANPAA